MGRDHELDGDSNHGGSFDTARAGDCGFDQARQICHAVAGIFIFDFLHFDCDGLWNVE